MDQQTEVGPTSTLADFDAVVCRDDRDGLHLVLMKMV